MAEPTDPELADLLAGTIAALREGGVADEALAELRTDRRVGPLRLPPKFVLLGRVWRLGEVLLTAEGVLLSTGSVTRAVEPTRFAANKSPAEAARRDLQRLAAKGPFAAGETVNYGHEPIEVHPTGIAEGSGRIVRRNGVLTLRLAHAEVAFDEYLAGRVRSMATSDWD